MNLRKQKTAVLRVTALLALLMRPGTALATSPSDVQAMLSTLFCYAMPTNPLRKGQKEIKLVPTYLVGDNPRSAPPGGAKADPYQVRNEKVSGMGWAGVFVWGFSEHLGISVLGAGMSESGTIDSEFSSPYPSDRNSFRKGKHTGSGYVGAASFIYDPFDGEGFRLPLMLGLSMNSYSGEVKAKNASGEPLGEKGSNQAPGILFGVTPQFNLGGFRAAPFLIVSMFGDNTASTQTKYLSSTGPATKVQRSIKSDTVGSVGIDLTYRPWGLGFSYIPDFSGVTAYTFKWVKKWGR